MLVDGYDIEVVREMLVKDIFMIMERYEFGVFIFKGMGDVVFVMGMIGILIGLVVMFLNMDDFKVIGFVMVVVLLIMFYGVFFVNVVCLLIVFKLVVRVGEEKLNQSFVFDGIVGIVDGQNLCVIEGVLKNYFVVSKCGSVEEE